MSLMQTTRALIRAANSRRAAARSIVGRRPARGQRRRRRGAPLRRRAPAPRPPPPASRRACRCNAAPVAAGRERGARALARSSPTALPWTCRRSSTSPSNPMKPRITSRIIVAEVVAGSTGSMAVKTTWAVMPKRQFFQRTECGEIGGFERRAVGVHHRQPLVAVGGGAAVAGDVLEHRQHAAVQQPLGDGRGDAPRPCPASRHRRGRRSPRRRRATGTSASGRQSTLMPSGRRSAAISRAPSRAAASPAARIAVVEPPIGRAGRIGRPVRRAEALHPAALLVDQDGRVGAQLHVKLHEQVQ